MKFISPCHNASHLERARVMNFKTLFFVQPQGALSVVQVTPTFPRCIVVVKETQTARSLTTNYEKAPFDTNSIVHLCRDDMP
jgi:hypothetical protein